MVLKSGDMWSTFEEADLFLITTNSKVDGLRRLVMGAGIAKTARDRFPGLDRALGNRVLKAGPTYGLLVSERWPVAKLGAFQTKKHWREPSTLELISKSADKLRAWCAAHPEAQVHLNLPGCGYGRLEPADVLPRLRTLSDNVTIWWDEKIAYLATTAAPRRGVGGFNLYC